MVQTRSPARLDTTVTTARPNRAARRHRWRRRMLVAGGLVAVTAGGGAVYWHIRTAVHPVSVSGAVNRFRSLPPPPTSAAPVDAAPAAGVYVYTTVGSEGVDVGGITHHYPARTVLTVTPSACGFSVRWDALAERWMQWQLCASAPGSAPGGWQMPTYSDYHEFLGVADRRTYTCTGDPVAPRSAWTETCRAAGEVVVETATVVGPEPVTVGGAQVPATHERIVTVGSGSTTSSGTTDVWLVEPSGLPGRIVASSTGSTPTMGLTPHYHETLDMQLVSLTPTR